MYNVYLKYKQILMPKTKTLIERLKTQLQRKLETLSSCVNDNLSYDRCEDIGTCSYRSLGVSLPNKKDTSFQQNLVHAHIHHVVSIELDDEYNEEDYFKIRDMFSVVLGEKELRELDFDYMCKDGSSIRSLYEYIQKTLSNPSAFRGTSRLTDKEIQNQMKDLFRSYISAIDEQKCCASEGSSSVEQQLHEYVRSCEPDKVESKTPLDIVIMIDISGSFINFITETKERLSKIISTISESSQTRAPRFKLIVYSDYIDLKGQVSDIMSSDHNACKAYSWKDCSQVTQIQEDINNIVLLDGGDQPEAVELALTHAAHLTDYREGAQKVLLCLADFAAHGYTKVRDDGVPPQYETSKILIEKAGYAKPSVAKAVVALKDKGVAVYPMIFGEDSCTRRFFWAISNLTGGSCCQVNTHFNNYSFTDYVLNKVVIEDVAKRIKVAADEFCRNKGIRLQDNHDVVVNALNKNEQILKLQCKAVQYKKITYYTSVGQEVVVELSDVENDSIFQEFVKYPNHQSQTKTLSIDLGDRGATIEYSEFTQDFVEEDDIPRYRGLGNNFMTMDVSDLGIHEGCSTEVVAKRGLFGQEENAMSVARFSVI